MNQVFGGKRESANSVLDRKKMTIEIIYIALGSCVFAKAKVPLPRRRA